MAQRHRGVAPGRAPEAISHLPAAPSVVFDVFRLDWRDERLWCGQEVVPLHPKTLAVLCCLVTQAGQLVTKDMLLETVWPATVVSESVLQVAIRKLRQVLGDQARTPRFIETVHGRGYRFIAPVRAPASPDGPAVMGALRHPPLRFHRPPHFVGRDTELAQLMQWWSTARQGTRQVGVIAGEPGIGKTALVQAFLAQVAAAGECRVGHGQCIEPYGPGEPYRPVLEALGRLGQEPDGPGLVTVLRQYAPSWLAQLPALVPPAEREALQRTVGPLAQTRMLRELTEALDDTRRLGRIYSAMANHYVSYGPYDRAIPAGQHAMALAAASGDVGTHVYAHIGLAQAYCSQGNYGQAVDACRHALAALEGERLDEFFGLLRLPAVFVRTWLAFCLAEVGEFAEGIAAGEAGLQLAKAVNHPFSLVTAYRGVIRPYLRQGDLDRALPLLDRALGLCQDADLLHDAGALTTDLAATYVLSGRGDEAVRILERTIAPDITRRGSTLWWWLFPLSEAYLYADRLEEARPLADRALAQARTRTARGDEAYALRLLGDIAMHSHPPAFQQAAAYYQPALTLANALGMRPLQGPLPPWSRPVVCHHRTATAGPCRACDGHGAVPVDGHDLLASRDRSGTGAGGRQPRLYIIRASDFFSNFSELFQDCDLCKGYASVSEPGSSTSPPRPPEKYAMVPPTDKPAPLSVHWAFVVQFQSDTAVEQGYLADRVEHVVSGQAIDFESLETLLAFMARVLRAEHEYSAEP